MSAPGANGISGALSPRTVAAAASGAFGGSMSPRLGGASTAISFAPTPSVLGGGTSSVVSPAPGDRPNNKERDKKFPLENDKLLTIQVRCMLHASFALCAIALIA